MARLRAREGGGVCRHARGQGAGDFPQPAALRGSADAAGSRRQIRYQPRARAPDRKPAQAPLQGVSATWGRRLRRGRIVRRNACRPRAPSATFSLISEEEGFFPALSLVSGIDQYDTRWVFASFVFARWSRMRDGGSIRN